MPSRPLPPRPHLDQYKKQAKDLLHAIRAGDAAAIARLRHAHVRTVDPAHAALADAQLVIAREHGCTSWPRFKQYVERHAQAASPPLVPDDLQRRFVQLVSAGNPMELDEFLNAHPEAHGLFDEPLFEAAQPAIVHVRRDRAMVDVLLKHDADVNARSQFWGRTIGVLDDNPSAAMRQYLVDRGAVSEMSHFADAIRAGDAVRVDDMLCKSPGLRAQINRPLFSFGSQAILVAKDNHAMVDVLLKHGADVNVRSHWAPGSFGILDGTSRETAAYLINRGATIDIHAACHLGMLERVRELLAKDPSLVHAKGGDGMRPLHVASTKEIIDLLLAHRADIDARDVDHNATAAQYAVNMAWKCRYLIERGAAVDVFMGAALGDVELTKRALREDPTAISARIDRDGYAPIAHGAANHIYCWGLGWGLSPHEVALKHSHRAVFDLLMAQSPPRERLLAACAVPLEEVVAEVLREDPQLPNKLTHEEQRLMVDAANTRNLDALRVMLDAGFPIDVTNNEGMSALHRAALCAYANVVSYLISRGASMTLRHNYGGDAISTCLWGSLNFRDRAGDYPATVETLIKAGAQLPKEPYGSDAVLEALGRMSKVEARMTKE